MKKATIILALALMPNITFAGKCTGKSNCTSCKNCHACKHCNSGGGKCGVCSPKKKQK